MPRYPFPRTLFFGYLTQASMYLLLLPLVPFTFDWLVKAAPVVLLAGVTFVSSGFRVLAFALLASATGDVLLAQAFDYALEAGMVAFAIAHLAYAVTFWPWRRPSKTKWLAIAILTAIIATILAILVPEAGALAVPICLYALVILGMSATAILAANKAQWMLPAGAAVFVASDTLIGVHLFLLQSTDSHISVMITYYAAQWLLFWGAHRHAYAA